MLNTQTNGLKPRSKLPSFNVVPLYVQVRDVFAGWIKDGQWPVDRIIPNEADLARDLNVSQGTARKALDILESEGLVIRKQGRGTFVVDKAAADEQRMEGCRLKAMNLIEGNVSKTIIRERVAKALFDAGYSSEEAA